MATLLYDHDGMFPIESDDRTIEEIFEAFNKFYVGKTNETYERYIFNARFQEETENIDVYLAELRKLAKTCNYGTLEDDLIRDRIVIGINNEDIRRKLLEKADLTLEKCIDTVRSMEIAGQHMQLCRKEAKIDRIGLHYKKQEDGTRQQIKDCSRCGKQHPENRCPAQNSKCNKCHRLGHYEKMCFSKQGKNSQFFQSQRRGKFRRYVNQIESDESENGGENFLGSVKTIICSKDPWMAEVELEDTAINFKLDTGADVTVVPERCVPRKVQLSATKKRLFGPGKEEVVVKGKFYTTLKRGTFTTEQTVYVIENLTEPLLGRPAIEKLKLLQRVNKIENRETYETEIKEKYPELFTGLGKIKNKEYKIRLHENVTPFSVSTPRRIPMPYYEKVKSELKRLEEMDIIKPVTKPTDWCAPMVVVPKQNGKVRICVDLTRLNQGVKRENFPMPCTDQLLSQLPGQNTWSKLDCNSGFHQQLLDEESQPLTTFITPFGRYCYKRLCFGISSGPEIFQREMCQLLEDIPGVNCAIDDILIGGSTQEEHDSRLQQVLTRLKEAGVTLNDKCRFNQNKIKFLGHVITNEGIYIDPQNKRAIHEFPAPQSVTELRRFLGMRNHTSKFIANVAEKTEPLRELLKNSNAWMWGESQKSAFETLKKDLTEAPVLTHYDANRYTKVTTDASKYGLGAVLYQKEGENWKPVFYASRSLTPTEQRYPQVEKEALGVTWGCERFSDYVIGLKKFQIETDHKPLLALLQTKRLDELTPRIQRFRMRLMRYTYTVQYTKGKDLHTADALSRAPLEIEKNEEENKDHLSEKEVDLFVNWVMESLPASTNKQEEISMKQDIDDTLKTVKEYCLEGWPSFSKKNDKLRRYFSIRHELAVHKGILMYRNRMVIPNSLQKDIINKIHESHLGIVKCRALANESVWWPGISKYIEDEVQNCLVLCVKYRLLPPQPLKPSETPIHPWQKIGMDLFEWKGMSYLLLVDYYSRWIDIAFLKTTTSSSVIEHTKSIFAKFGIPEKVVSDNGPQFSSAEFKNFAKSYGFEHNTSSPRYAPANGEAERAVRTVKNLLKKAKDPNIALLNYRATPLEHGLSPAELLMGRKIRTKLPALRESYKAQTGKNFQQKDKQLKDRQKRNFDKIHKARPLNDISVSAPVWVYPQRQQGTVISAPTAEQPFRYQIKTSLGNQYRNRIHLRHRDVNEETTRTTPKPNDIVTIPRRTTGWEPASSPQSSFESSNNEEDGASRPTTITNSDNNALAPPTPSPPTYVTRHGRKIIRPARYREC